MRGEPSGFASSGHAVFATLYFSGAPLLSVGAWILLFALLVNGVGLVLGVVNELIEFSITDRLELI